MTTNSLEYAHSFSLNNSESIKASVSCACFYCKTRFTPVEVVDFCDKGNTALCPKCGIDSVIGDASGISLSASFVVQLHDFWFNSITPSY